MLYAFSRSTNTPHTKFPKSTRYFILSVVSRIIITKTELFGKSEIFFHNFFSHWVHKKCSGVTGSLKSNPDYRCSRCKGTARPIDGRPHNEWLLMQDKKLDVVDSFCYLGDTIGAGGGCDLSVITRIRSA